jgi:predicted dehydrogenase
MASAYAPGLRADTRARLVAVQDAQAEARNRFAHEHEVEHAVARFDELIEEVDVVILTTPMPYHAPQACEALARDVHVLSEVPAAISYEQAHGLVAAVRSSNALYAMAENYLYLPPHLTVRELVRAGELGELYYGETDHVSDVKDQLRDEHGNPRWHYHWWVGRDGNTYPTHSFGPLLQWFDDRVVSVSCVGSGRHTAPEHEMQDTTVLLARTVRGGLLRVRLDWLSNRPFAACHHFGLQGTGGAYDQGNPGRGVEPAIYLHGRSPSGRWEPLASFAEEYFPRRYAYPPGDLPAWGSSELWPIAAGWLLQDFFDSLLEGRALSVDVYAALDMTLPGLAAEASIAQAGAWIHVPNPRFFSSGIGAEPGTEFPLA